MHDITTQYALQRPPKFDVSIPKQLLQYNQGRKLMIIEKMRLYCRLKKHQDKRG